MKKILPVNLKTGMETECWNFYKLAALLSDDKYLPWYVERFIELQMYDNFNVHYYAVNSFDCGSPEFDDVLEFEELRFKKSDIKEVIQNKINDNCYVMLYLDMCYFTKDDSMNTDFLNNEHRMHEIMIIGYDTENSHFYFVVLDEETQIWTIKEAHIDALLRSYEASLKVLQKDIENYSLVSAYHYPACAFRLREIKKEKVLVNRVYESIKRFLFGEVFTSDYYQLPNEKTGKVTRKGVSIYDGYYDGLYTYLKENGPQIIQNDINILLGVKKLLESKAGLMFRLKYLQEHQNLNISEEIINEIGQLCNILSKVLGVLELYSYSGKNNLLDYMSNNMKKAKELDVGILKKIIKSFDIYFETGIREINNIFDDI